MRAKRRRLQAWTFGFNDGRRSLGAGKRDDPRHHSLGDRRRAGFARLEMKQCYGAFFSETALPMSDRWSACIGATLQFQHRQPITRHKLDLRAQHVFKRRGEITDNLFETLSVGGFDEDADHLGYDNK